MVKVTGGLVTGAFDYYVLISLQVRITLHPKAGIEIQVVPVPDGIGPFRFLPSSRRSEKVRPIVLDPENTDTLAESEVQKDFRLYKTTERGVYDAASRRGGESSSSRCM